MQDPNVYRRAVLGVYMNLIRYSRMLDSSLSKKISQQFRRHQRRGNTGHLRAGYRLEEQLREVLTGNLQLSELKRLWIPSKQEPPEELNAVGRRRLWSLQPERAWDEFNSVQLSSKNSSVSTREANLRARYMREHNIARENADPVVIDTVFAPLWQGPSRSAAAPSITRHQNPPKVSIHTVVRSGGELSVLRVQGRKPRAKGFARHISKILRADADDEKYKSLEVHRRILIDRAATIQRNMVYWHQRKSRQPPLSRSTYTTRLLPGLIMLSGTSQSHKHTHE